MLYRWTFGRRVFPSIAVFEQPDIGTSIEFSAINLPGKPMEIAIGFMTISLRSPSLIESPIDCSKWVRVVAQPLLNVV